MILLHLPFLTRADALAFKRVINIFIVLILFCAVSIASAQDSPKKVWLGSNLEFSAAGVSIGSDMFGGEYAHFDGLVNDTSLINGFSFAGGLMLNVRATGAIILVTGVNYRWSTFSEKIHWLRETFEVRIHDHAINIPVLLRLRAADVTDESGIPTYMFIEAGAMWGVPFSSNARVGHHKYSDFRAVSDFGIVGGFGVGYKEDAIITWRFVIPRTRLDKYNAINAPGMLGVVINVPILKLR